MKINDYNKKKKQIFIILFSLGILTSLLVYFLTSNIAAAVSAAACSVLSVILTSVLNRLDDRFITDIVSDLSSLIDILSELEEKDIFPANEDTVTSKLQSKVINLSRILKKKNSDSLQRQENIKKLVSDISHQLKTPIANLKMYSEFLADEDITLRQRKEYINVITLSIDRLNFLSENMIKISRLESGLINISPVLQSLNETVLKSIKDVFHKARLKDVEITFSENGRIDAVHDRNWTSEAIFNLLDNAVKYSEKGSMINVTMKTFGIFAAVEVSDHNKPIPESDYAKIFQRFYRGSNSGQVEGIGVGLYLAREIAVKQGGYINIKSSAAGNTFSLVMPVADRK